MKRTASLALLSLLMCLSIAIANDFDWEVGKTVDFTFINGKIMQVVDKNKMLVGIEDAKNGPGKYRQWVMVKHPTKGLVDDKFFGTDWVKVVGSNRMKVTGTTTYKTLSGTRTVFVLVPVEMPKLLPIKPKDPKIAEYSGLWTVLDRNGRLSHSIRLYSTLAVTRSQRNEEPLKGTWELVDGEPRITYDNGDRAILRKDKMGMLELSLEPKADWDGKVLLRRRTFLKVSAKQ